MKVDTVVLNSSSDSYINLAQTTESLENSYSQVNVLNLQDSSGTRFTVHSDESFNAKRDKL